MSSSQSSNLSIHEVKKIYHLTMIELLYRAHSTHRKHFDPKKIQTSKLLSIKTGGCPENCSYCPQSAHYKTGVEKEKLMDLNQVISAAKKAKEEGATRFCMGAAWREVRDGPQFDQVLEMVSAVHKLDMEVCCTLGMISKSQAKKLKQAGLYAYNHNIDCSENFYPNIITTRSYKDRIQTIHHVREAGITVCTGGILGMGETEQDRIDFLHQLAIFDPQP
ncbi:MAG: biotin synthase BioB, partial [Bdellovibrionales bacterium]|nr:biotin synthase BioB [Bdellovibrionales bacterium]